MLKKLMVASSSANYQHDYQLATVDGEAYIFKMAKTLLAFQFTSDIFVAV